MTRRLLIELDRGGVAPAGVLRVPGGAPMAFDGWLQLLGALRDAKADPPAFDLSVTANDQTKFGPQGPIGPPEDSVGIAELRISQWTLDVSRWNRSRATAKAGQRVKLVTRGWTNAGDALYIHYLRAGKAVHTEKLGALKAPCGDLTKTFKAFAFKTAKRGTYGLRFSTSAKWSAKDAWLGYRAVRLLR